MVTLVELAASLELSGHQNGALAIPAIPRFSREITGFQARMPRARFGQKEPDLAANWVRLNEMDTRTLTWPIASWDNQPAAQPRRGVLGPATRFKTIGLACSSSRPKMASAAVASSK